MSLATKSGCQSIRCTGVRIICSRWRRRLAGPCYTSKVQKNYDLCSRCWQRPQAERAAPFSRRQGRTRGHEDNGPALMKWCAAPRVVLLIAVAPGC
jgi:hypothetical protein